MPKLRHSPISQASKQFLPQQADAEAARLALPPAVREFYRRLFARLRDEQVPPQEETG
ncbi:MAG: hypothetical protein H0U60_13185 [Blastocatellia bacterium]|nr:hypothetical protein [Blastocatellia bacterium]